MGARTPAKPNRHHPHPVISLLCYKHLHKENNKHKDSFEIATTFQE